MLFDCCIENHINEENSLRLNLEEVLSISSTSDSTISTDQCIATIRSIDNGDKILFIEINPKTEVLIAHAPVLSNKKLDLKYRSPNVDNRYGYNKLTGWQLLAACERYSFISSKQYIYRELKEGDSKLLELIEERPLQHLLDEGELKISRTEYSSSVCIVISSHQLFESEESLDAYLSMYYGELYANNAACSSWYLPYALNTKLAESIIPYTPDGYQVSVHHSSKKELLPLFRKYHDRFLYNLLVNAVVTVTEHHPKADGLFLTTFTSSWLFKRYGLSAPYIDTRLNETFSNAYEDIRKEIPSLSGVDISFNYAEFLLKKEKDNGVYRTKNGLFFPDYFDLDGKHFTHTSLNHQLGIASYFLKKYEQSKKCIYLETYKKLVDFIRDTAQNWIDNCSGDLFYEIIEGSDGGWKFQSKDYVYVTLNDLLNVLKNYRLLFLSDMPEIELLIKSKLNFLDDSGFGIFDSYAPAPSGEGMMSKEVAKRLLKETGMDRFSKKNYFKKDELHNYSYNFELALPLPVSRAISRLQFIEYSQGSIRFNDPAVFHWSYAIEIYNEIEMIGQSGYLSNPLFKTPFHSNKIKKLNVFIKDEDSNSRIAKVTLTPVNDNEVS